MTPDNYIDARIAALTRNGAIAALNAEATLCEDAICTHFAEVRRQQRQPSWTFVRVQTERARAFRAEALRLDDERPAGAAGLAS